MRGGSKWGRKFGEVMGFDLLINGSCSSMFFFMFGSGTESPEDRLLDYNPDPVGSEEALKRVRCVAGLFDLSFNEGYLAASGELVQLRQQVAECVAAHTGGKCDQCAVARKRETELLVVIGGFQKGGAHPSQLGTDVLPNRGIRSRG